MGPSGWLSDAERWWGAQFHAVEGGQGRVMAHWRWQRRDGAASLLHGVVGGGGGGDGGLFFGGEGGYALFLSADLQYGTTQPSTTFGSPALLSIDDEAAVASGGEQQQQHGGGGSGGHHQMHHFQVSAVELWGVEDEVLAHVA